MTALQIEEISAFTRKLFLETAFDGFWVKEAVIVTFNRFSIDGRIRPGFFNEEELEEMGITEYALWRQLRPICFSLIKGKRLPESFQITLQLPKNQEEIFLKEKGLEHYRPEQISGLYLHIRYEGGDLKCVTGTSLTVFTMDRALEQGWDEYAAELLKSMGIAVIASTQ